MVRGRRASGEMSRDPSGLTRRPVSSVACGSLRAGAGVGVAAGESEDPSGEAPISLKNDESSESASSSRDEDEVSRRGLPNMRMRCSSVKLKSRFVRGTLSDALSLTGPLRVASLVVSLEDQGHQPMLSVHLFILW